MKLVIVFRSELKMPKGKLVAQGGHAVQYVFTEVPTDKHWKNWRDEWVQGDHTKVALKANDEDFKNSIMLYLRRSKSHGIA